MLINDETNLGYVNVRCSPYNATGDGTEDDTNAFQQALNDVESMRSGIKGLQIYYPSQVVEAPPIPYPWTIQCENGRTIDAVTYGAPRHWFENVYGQPLSIGISVDQCYDIGRINHIHFWPFWSNDPIIRVWVEHNGISFLFQRTDWKIVEDIFSIGYQIGMAFHSSEHGACNGQFTDINFDNVDIGLEVLHTQAAGILFSNLNLANAGAGANQIGIVGRQGNDTNPLDAALTIRGASFWGRFQKKIHWSHEGFISVSDSLFRQWNSTSSAIFIERGRAMINNNTLDIVTKPTVLLANNLP